MELSSGKKSIKIGKYQINARLVILFAAVLILLIAAIAGAAAGGKKRAARIKAEEGYTFDSQSISGAADIEIINEAFAVYTDTNGKKGILALDGTVTEEASQDKIYVLSDSWRSYKYVCEGPLSEYRLLIDPRECKITAKQYHGPDKPEYDVLWNKEGKHLAKSDGMGYAGEIMPGELALEEGLYPVADSAGTGAKYGFINERLQLDIALIYNGAGDFSEGLAPVNKDGLWGYIDEAGKTVIPCIYESIGKAGAYTFRNGLAPVKKEGRCGLINRRGSEVTAFDLEDILQGKDGKYIAKKNGVWGILTVNEDKFAAENTTQATTSAPAGTVTGGNYVVKTKGSTLNLRATADANSAILARIPNGTKITVTKTVPGWAYTVYGSAQGWVSTDYIEQAQTTAAETQSATAESETAAG